MKAKPNKSEKTRVCIGIDIGASGGIAVIKEGILDFYCAMKRKEQGVDINETSDLLAKYSGDNFKVLVVMENLRSLFGMSAKSNFTFGYNNGVIVAIVEMLKLPYIKVHPRIWQQSLWMGVKTVKVSTGKKDKEGKMKQKTDTKATSLLAAQRLFPKEKFLETERCKVPHDGIVDAVLMAEYARRVMYGIND